MGTYHTAKVRVWVQVQILTRTIIRVGRRVGQATEMGVGPPSCPGHGCGHGHAWQTATALPSLAPSARVRVILRAVGGVLVAVWSGVVQSNAGSPIQCNRSRVQGRFWFRFRFRFKVPGRGPSAQVRCRQVCEGVRVRCGAVRFRFRFGFRFRRGFGSPYLPGTRPPLQLRREPTQQGGCV